jgi:hypothetical protein
MSEQLAFVLDCLEGKESIVEFCSRYEKTGHKR